MCAWYDKRKTIKITCEYCGVEYNKTLSEYKRSEKLGRKHFCSLKCNKSHKKRVDKKCLNCGNEYHSKQTNSKFCSRSCSATYNNKNRNEQKRNFSEIGLTNIRISNQKKYKVNHDTYKINPKHCKNCDKELSFKDRKKTFCDIKCKREYERKHMSKYQKYYRDCQFKFNLSDYPNEFDFSLIENYGWYKAKNRGDNLNGVSRDHMISVRYGYDNNISPDIISHPANCRLMRHNDNVSKHSKCSITIDELLTRIEHWNVKYTPIV